MEENITQNAFINRSFGSTAILWRKKYNIMFSLSKCKTVVEVCISFNAENCVTEFVFALLVKLWWWAWVANVRMHEFYWKGIKEHIYWTQVM